MQTLTHGILITIEGIDGSGKSTLSKALYQQLMAQHCNVVLTKEPGGSKLGQVIRTVVQERTIAINPLAEFLLFAADRAQHFDEFVLPALNQKKIVISDRMADSSVAYQGFARGLPLESITAINQWCMRSVQPQLTFYLRIDAQTAFNRITARNQQLTSFESQKREFTNNVITGFDTLAQAHPERIVTLDARKDSACLVKQALEIVELLIRRYCL